MAVGEYLSSKSEQEYNTKERIRKESEIEKNIGIKREDMIKVYLNKGYSRKDSEKIATLLEKNNSAFVDTMMIEEHGILENKESPIKTAIVTFSSFVMFGIIPLIAFVLTTFFQISMNMFAIAIILTGLTLFSLGALKTYITGKNWFTSGLEMLLVGGVAASAAYLIGVLLGGLA
jgi:VIT1/CCC1 family predicted Fe2+/Mn2+ transporter